MQLEQKIFELNTRTEFNNLALEVFRFQYQNNGVYRKFCNLLNVKASEIKNIEHIPFLPIELFKQHKILCDSKQEEIVFTSSGTTGSVTSKHYVSKLNLYKKSFKKGFEKFYGTPSQWTILALLPSYLERQGSSLIYMFEHLIEDSKTEESGFYLNNTEELIQKLEALESKGKKTLLLGVSYALLDLMEIKEFRLQHTHVMETGGMKGRRKEMVKSELHDVLKKGFGVSEIHSEYGMTELLSQAYSKGAGLFQCPPWMKILTRDTEDPLTLIKEKTGGINVIDLANLYSCSFIATQDLGKVYKNDTFEILGRFDSSDIRGCNLMIL